MISSGLALGEVLVVLATLGALGLIAVVIVAVTRRGAAAVAPSGPGWYPDPSRSGAGWRWWDGKAWTEHTELNHPTPERSA